MIRRNNPVRTLETISRGKPATTKPSPMTNAHGNGPAPPKGITEGDGK